MLDSKSPMPLQTPPSASTRAPLRRLALALATLGVGCSGKMPLPQTSSDLAGVIVDGGLAARDDGGCVLPGQPLIADVPYVVRGVPMWDALTRLDIYPHPSGGCRRPVVVWVHGGGWHDGDKSNQIPDKLRLFQGLGYVFVSVNYRLSDPGIMPLVQHPMHVQDVALALAWVRQSIAGYGGDPSRVAALGHSAGAHLVALAATDERYLGAAGAKLNDLRCIGSYDGDYNIDDVVARDAQYAQIFTTDLAAQRDASPTTHVAAGKGIPSFQLACRGTQDRVAQCQGFANQLRAAGSVALTIDATSLTHDEVNSHIGAAGDAVMTAPVVAFLQTCFP